VGNDGFGAIICRPVKKSWQATCQGTGSEHLKSLEFGPHVTSDSLIVGGTITNTRSCSRNSRSGSMIRCGS